jgi:ParB-like chromosome segregation protein Spo0J
MKIHPAAEIFPMMSEEELERLAFDIKVKGQQFPIVQDKDGILLDGRNRLEACHRANVEPKFDILKDGQDPVAFILAANIKRRHMSKGQQAMAVAKIYPEPTKLKRKGSSFNVDQEFDPTYVSYARTILKFASELADHVLFGTTSLNEAYEEALIRKASSESLQGRLQRLKRGAPDLANLVEEAQMKLQEAEATHEQRKKEERDQRAAIYGLLEKEKVFVETLEGAGLENLVETITKHPKECSQTEIRKLAHRLAAGWHKLEEALK